MSKPSAPSPKTPSSRCNRRPIFLQFSLRTLLALTTLAALACWWFLHPETRYESLAGDQLKLRRQIASTRLADKMGVAVVQTSGRWQLYDRHDGLLIDGHMLADEPAGTWQTYYTNGNLATEGNRIRGVSDGVWKTLYANGQLRSEVTYRVIPTDGLLQRASPWPSLMTCGLSARKPTPWLPFVAIRRGRSTEWHPIGAVKSTGQFEHDRRHGKWSFYRDDGQLLETGAYTAGLRHGRWLLWQPATRSHNEVEYFLDIPRTTYEPIATQCQADFDSADLDRQLSGMHRLDELGFAALPSLAAALAASSDDVKQMALRRLVRLWEAAHAACVPHTDEFASSIAIQLQPLLENRTDHLAWYARYCLYLYSPPDRDRLYPFLIEQLPQMSLEQHFPALQTLYHLQPKARATLLAIIAATSQRDEMNDFHAIPLRFDNLANVVSEAMAHPNPVVRRFALEVVERRCWQEPATTETLPSGQKRTRFAIPEAFREAVKRGRQDPDPAVRNAAERVGEQPFGGIPVVG